MSELVGTVAEIGTKSAATGGSTVPSDRCGVADGGESVGGEKEDCRAKLPSASVSEREVAGGWVSGGKAQRVRAGVVHRRRAGCRADPPGNSNNISAKLKGHGQARPLGLRQCRRDGALPRRPRVCDFRTLCRAGPRGFRGSEQGMFDECGVRGECWDGLVFVSMCKARPSVSLTRLGHETERNREAGRALE
jgi:hypothetical protein